MRIKCATCGVTTVIPQQYPFHSGFSGRGFLYCDSFPAILEFDTYNPKYTAIVGNKHPWSLSSEEKQRVENALKPFAHYGRFRFGALPRCPACYEPLSELLKDDIHFVEIGDVINADTEDVWI